MPDFTTARKNMVDSQIHTAGVIDPRILKAFRDVPRETFVPANLQNICCADEEAPLGGGRYLPEPSVHARMLQALNPEKHHRVLDIGGTSGYPPAIMSFLSGQVYALEEPQFLDYASQAWAHMGLDNIIPVKGTLIEGCSIHTPYDIIFMNGAVSEIPFYLASQLSPGGRLIAVVKKPGAVMGQVMLVQSGVGSNKFSSRPLFEAAGHYLPGFEPQPAFHFGN